MTHVLHCAIGLRRPIQLLCGVGTWVLASGVLAGCSNAPPSGAASEPSVGGAAGGSAGAVTASARGGAANGGAAYGGAATVDGGGAMSGGAASTTMAGVIGRGGTGVGGSVAMGGAAGRVISANGGMAVGGRSSTGGTTSGGAAMAGSSGKATSGGGTAGSIAKGGTGGTNWGGAASGGTGSSGAATGGAVTGSGGSSVGGAGQSPCPGATKTITVAADGSAQFTTVQAAINSIATSNSTLVEVALKAGRYSEKVTIDKPYVCLVGVNVSSTIITNTNGTSIGNGGTVIVTGNDFSAANVTFENSAPDGSAQAVALMASGQRQQFLNCRFVSYQDTLYVNTGTQYFRSCYIQGNTDYIFGDATAVFDTCTMNNVSEGTAVTAPRTPQNATYGFVFLGGSVTANPTTSAVRANHVHLGRPWGPYAAAAFLNVSMGAHIASAGWTTMSGNDLSNTRFWEYKSTGAGASAADATRSSRQLSDTQAANYTVKNVLRPWLPTYSQ